MACTRTHRLGGRSGLALIAALAAMIFAAAPAAASGATPAHGRITRGDVIAAFQARTTGAYVQLRAGRVIAAPIRGLHEGRIDPFRTATYCNADWHYLGVSYLGSGGYGAASALLHTFGAEFLIDGASVPVTLRTPVKRFVDGIPGDFGISYGALIAPGSLSPGWHTLTTRFVAGLDSSELTVGFEILDTPC
jgi:hypothetical protein